MEPDLTTLLDRRRFNGRSNDSGQGLAEYIIIVILVAIIVLVAVKFFGKSVFNQFENATNEINTLQEDSVGANPGTG